MVLARLLVVETWRIRNIRADGRETDLIVLHNDYNDGSGSPFQDQLAMAMSLPFCSSGCSTSMVWEPAGGSLLTLEKPPSEAGAKVVFFLSCGGWVPLASLDSNSGTSAKKAGLMHAVHQKRAIDRIVTASSHGRGRKENRRVHKSQARINRMG